MYLKDIRNIRFINRRESHGRRALYDCLRKYAFPNTNRLVSFPFGVRNKERIIQAILCKPLSRKISS